MIHFKSVIILLLLVKSCTPQNKPANPFDLQGHRGARGLLPENSIPSFLKALDLGVTTLELDLCVTKDQQLVLSHEPIMSAMICTDSEGNTFSDSLAHTYNIYSMTYEEVKSFDCGSKSHPWYPKQKKIATHKPLLTEVFQAVNDYMKDQKAENMNRESVHYNIEIKTQQATDYIYHPTPQQFADLVYKTISQNIDWKYITIQSFDFRVLQYFHKTYPQVKLALLIENQLSPKQNLDSLGFTPNIYSCEHVLLSREMVSQLQSMNMQVIPWTVNESARMDTLQSWKVDGLITDYPDRFKRKTSE